MTNERLPAVDPSSLPGLDYSDLTSQGWKLVYFEYAPPGSGASPAVLYFQHATRPDLDLRVGALSYNRALDEVRRHFYRTGKLRNTQRPDSPQDIRAKGWMVAVHNDYRQGGEDKTFWLFTRGNFSVKGEGNSDEAALNLVRQEIDRLEMNAFPYLDVSERIELGLQDREFP